MFSLIYEEICECTVWNEFNDYLRWSCVNVKRRNFKNATWARLQSSNKHELKNKFHSKIIINANFTSNYSKCGNYNH